MKVKLLRLRRRIYNKYRFTLLTCPKCSNIYEILILDKDYTMCPYCDFEFNPREGR